MIHNCPKDAILTDEDVLYHSLAVTASMIAVGSGAVDRSSFTLEMQTTPSQINVDGGMKFAKAVWGVFVDPCRGEYSDAAYLCSV